METPPLNKVGLDVKLIQTQNPKTDAGDFFRGSVKFNL